MNGLFFPIRPPSASALHLPTDAGPAETDRVNALVHPMGRHDEVGFCRMEGKRRTVTPYDPPMNSLCTFAPPASVLAMLLLGLAAPLTACDDSRARPSGPVTGGGVDLCGNGKLDRGETCDTRIPTSSIGACPSACDDGQACTNDRLVGSAAACNAICDFAPISACVGGDGCCPMGCTATGPNGDSDCSSTCNNGRVDANETCDGDCAMSCNDNVACTTDTAYGSASTCSLSCGYRVAQPGACNNGDGCCAPGCTNANDSDCSASCGNNMVDPGETCDGNCPTSCEDGDRCTIGIMSGSREGCNVSCTQQKILVCVTGDGCCAAGCTAANDMDCPQSCTGVTACNGGDRCCPSGCNNSNDSDCSGAPTLRVGAACTDASDCGSLLGSSVGCRLDLPGGYCTVSCTNGVCPSGSHCGRDFFCIEDCTDPGMRGSCREGYLCTPQGDSASQTFFGCSPRG